MRNIWSDQFHMTRAEAQAGRPAYQTDGTRHWITGDGADDYLRADAPVSSYPFSLSVAAQPNLDASTGGVFSLYQSNVVYKGIMQSHRSGYSFEAGDRNADNIKPRIDIGNGNAQVFTGDFTAAQTTLKVAGQQDFDPNTNEFGTLPELHLLSFRGDGWTGRVYAAVALSEVPSAADQALVDAWLSQKGGIA